MPRLDLTKAEQVKLGKLIVQAWQDPKTHKQLLEDPENALKAAGIKTDAKKFKGIRIVVVEDTRVTKHLVLPRNPRDDDPTVVLPDLISEDFIKHVGEAAFSGCK